MVSSRLITPRLPPLEHGESELGVSGGDAAVTVPSAKRTREHLAVPELGL